MAGMSITRRGSDRTAAGARLRADTGRDIPPSRVVVHAVMLTIVLSVALAMLLVTAWGAALAGEGLHELVSEFQRSDLGWFFRHLFTDANGAPLLLLESPI